MAPTSATSAKRGPTVLVQIPREGRPSSRKPPSRFITVDSVLQYASDIPSMQQRQPMRPRAFRTASGNPIDPRLTGRYVPPHMPQRSTKKSEKLVLLPESIQEEIEVVDFEGDEDKGPPKADQAEYRMPASERSRSYAERLPKNRRTEKDLSRVTAYCTAQAYKMQATAAFIRERHAARAKLYDDCLYVAYHLPLLQGTDGYRIQSSPPVKTVTGASLLDEAIERSERQDYHGAYFAEDEEQHSVRNEGKVTGSPAEQAVPANGQADEQLHENGHRRESDQSHMTSFPANVLQFAEMYIFSYGVVVFWNFTERQEKDVLADLTFSTSFDPKTNIASPLGLAVNPLDEEDFETEEFHFEYNSEILHPRVYNDMITLRSGDHMIKLAISHAIAQSTKLSYFEEAMATQLEEAKDVPKRLALTGELGMKREEVIKLMGALFKSRVEINLSSNVLDAPNFIWDSEPTLHPLYTAVRQYLEIKPRIQVLNERCRVFLDLAEVLSEFISDNKMSRITWIIIVLIGISILVTCSEVFLRFGILSTRGTTKVATERGGTVLAWSQ